VSLRVVVGEDRIRDLVGDCECVLGFVDERVEARYVLEIHRRQASNFTGSAPSVFVSWKIYAACRMELVGRRAAPARRNP
jgi:hypothetical protein